MELTVQQEHKVQRDQQVQREQTENKALLELLEPQA